MLTIFPPHYCCLSFSGVTWQTLLYVCCGCEYVALATSLPALLPLSPGTLSFLLSFG